MRMRDAWVAALIVMGIAVVSGDALAGEDAGPQDGEEREVKITPQTTCPVMGGKINKDLYVDHDGRRVYVCCKGCIAPLKKDPQKYIRKLEDQGVTIARLQTTCPVMGGKINKDLYVDHDGKRIYMCCKGCTAPLKKDPQKYIKKLEEDGVVLDRVPSAKAEAGK